MKLITVYESKVPVCRGRREVLGQRVCSGWEPPSQIWAEVNQYIQQVYRAKQAPRTREGCDILHLVAFNDIIGISIHAPVKGATQ